MRSPHSCQNLCHIKCSHTHRLFSTVPNSPTQPVRMESVKTLGGDIKPSPHRQADNLLQRAAGSDTTVLAIIKANAYSHSAELCAPHPGPRRSALTPGRRPPRRAPPSAGPSPPQASRQPRILVMCPPLSPRCPLSSSSTTSPPPSWLPQHIDWLTAAANKAYTPSPHPIWRSTPAWPAGASLPAPNPSTPSSTPFSTTRTSA